MAKSSRPPSKNKPPAAPVPLSAPASEPAPRTPAASAAPPPASAAPVVAAAPAEPIEQQVEALIDQAQQQAREIADLATPSASGEATDEAAPGHPLSPEG